MRVIKTVLCSAAFAIGAATSAQASIVTYDFTVTDSSHVVHDGSLSFDSSSIVDSGRAGSDVLTSLSFNWNGIAYSTANANDGSLYFNSTGQLITGCIGDDLASGTCEFLRGTSNDWIWAIGGNFIAIHGCGRGPAVCLATGPTGPITTQVPEPGILTLFGIALTAAGLLIRKRQPKI